MYVHGGESDGVLWFLYTISEGERAGDLDTSGQNSLVIPEGASIKVRWGLPLLEPGMSWLPD